MLVYRYDKTFDGLLTAVFEAYETKRFPEHLTACGEPLPLFAETVVDIATDRTKSARVWSALEKLVPKLVCNMMMHVWLSESPEGVDLLFRYIRKIIDSKGNVTRNFADDDVLEVKKLARKVSHEGHYLAQFIRFQKTADDTYFAPVQPVFNVLPMIIKHMKDRFADQKWLIYDMRRNYGFFHDLRTVTEVVLSTDGFMEGVNLDPEHMAADEKLFQNRWKSYFKALTIQERVNPRLQRQHMPRRYWKYLTEKQ